MKITIARALLLVCLAAPGFGALSITLDNSSLAGAPGDTITFSGSLTNDDLEPDFINGADFTIANPDLSGDATPLFIFAPASLDAGAGTGSIPLFTIAIADPSLSGPGTYSGFFNVTGGFGEQDSDLIGTVGFEVTVTPEPGTLLPGLAAALAVFAIKRKRVRNQ